MEQVKSIDKYIESMQDSLVSFGGRLLGALVILLIGFWVINRFVKLLNRVMVKREVDESLRPFLKTLVNIILKVSLLIPVIQLLGIATSSFLAILGSAGLAVGLALQGSLSNFAGGVILLTIRPFRKGHVIRAAGETGTVHQIGIFNTVLKTADNQTIYIPNGILAGSTITNFSDEPNRRIVLDLSIGYEDEIARAKQIVRDTFETEARLLREPPWQMVITELSASSVVLSARAWVKNEAYWDTLFDLREKLKLAFDREGISIPYPQTTVHLGSGFENFLNKTV